MLIESVPNVSEGRRLDVVDRMASAIEAGDGVFLLDRTSDASHNRSVFTIAGEHEAVADALERLVEVAVHEIDMDSHTGEHPRIGAVDVIPFVPLGSTTMDDCIEMARDFGARIATRFDLPVFLYANAATRPERVKLADVRRGQYEGLKNEIEEPGRAPDFGPPRLHPSAGAVAVGARPFLIAYNINLASKDVELAKRIARRVRESGGGLPKVQANGFWIEELGRAQVSMNILDFSVTPLWLVWETVRDVAAEDGVVLAESELIGLAPLAAFLAVADRVDAPAGGSGRTTTGRRSRVPPAARLLPDAGTRTATRGRARRPAHGDERRAVPAHPRRPQRGADARPADRRRLGGRDPRRAACGWAIARAMSSGCRRPMSAGPTAPDAPVVACWEGRIVAVGPRAALETALEAEGYQLGRFARLDAGGGSVTPGPGRPAHAPPVRRLARGRVADAPARRRLSRDPRGRRRDPVDGGGDA